MLFGDAGSVASAVYGDFKAADCWVMQSDGHVVFDVEKKQTGVAGIFWKWLHWQCRVTLCLCLVRYCSWVLLPEASFSLRVLSLPLSVCPSVRVCGNHLLVRAITHHPFKLGSPNFGP